MMLRGRRHMAELSPSKSKPRCRPAHGFAIDNCRLAGEVGSGADDRGIPAGPIVSFAGQNTRLSPLKQHLAAIAIVLDFVNSVLALWRLIDRGSELRRNKAKGNAGHATNLARQLEIASHRVRWNSLASLAVLLVVHLCQPPTQLEEQSMTNQSFRQAANSPFSRHAAEAARRARESVKSAAELAKSTAQAVTEDVSDFASDATRRVGKQYGRARDAAVDAYDEMYDRAVENPYVTLGLAIAIGFLLGAFLVGRR